MIDDDWKILMKALSINALAVHFSKGLRQTEEMAVADHMIGIGDLIEAYPVPTFIRALSDALAQVNEEKRSLERSLKDCIPFMDHNHFAHKIEETESKDYKLSFDVQCVRCRAEVAVGLRVS